MSLRTVSRRTTSFQRSYFSLKHRTLTSINQPSRRHLNLPSNLHDLRLLPNMHAKATIDGTVIAETDTFEYVEGNVYFPRSALINPDQFLMPSSHISTCPWKGEGNYYDINVNGRTLENAAWYYPEPKSKAENIRDYVAFYKGKVDVEKEWVAPPKAALR